MSINNDNPLNDSEDITKHSDAVTHAASNKLFMYARVLLSGFERLVASVTAARKYIDHVLHPINVEYLKYPKISFDNKWGTLLVASLAIHLLSLGLPVTTLQVYDRILVSQNLNTLNALAFGVTVAVVLEGIIRAARTYVVNWSSAVYEHALQCNALRHILRADLSHIERDDISTHLSRMSAISRMREFTSGQAFITLIDLPFVAVYLALIAYLAGSLVFVPVAILLIFSLVALRLGKKIKAHLEQREASDTQRMSFFIQVLTGIHTAKSLGHENQLVRQYEELQQHTSTLGYFISKATNTAANYSALFTQLMNLSMITVGAVMVLDGQLTMGTLIACVLLSGRIMSPIQKALGIWTRFQDYLLAREQVKAMFDIPITDCIGKDAIGFAKGEVKLQGLTFAYSGQDKPLIDGINLTLNAGQSIAIGGDHSCGKTTLLKLICGLYLPQAGQALVNGLASHQYPPEELIKHLGYLPMDGVIFRGSIADNLSAFGAHTPSNVDQIIRLLGIDKEIAKLPAGFDTQLEGSSSDVIPPGLKQRIAIARVLAAKPRILLFDNADRGLDKEGYNYVYKLLAKLKGRITLVLISDDKNILHLSDKDYVLDDGHLIERQNIDSSKLHDVKPYQMLRL